MKTVLQPRTAVPLVTALLLLPHVVPAVLLGVLLGLALVPAGIRAMQVSRRFPKARTALRVAAAAYACGVVAGADVVLNGGAGGWAAAAASIVAASLFFATNLMLFHARSPHETREGVLDALAALAGLVVIQSQWLALDPAATVHSVAARISPLVGGFLFITLVITYYGIAQDRRQKRTVLVARVAGGAAMMAAVRLTESFSHPEHMPWAVSCFLLAGALMFYVYNYPDYGVLFEPAPPRKRYLAVRWVGPACALATTPLMVLIFVNRGAVPTPAIAVACALLTGLALWRGLGLSRESERAARQLTGEQRFRNLVAHATDVIVIVDDHLRVSYANGGLEHLLGSSGEELTGSPVTDLFDGEGAAYLRSTLATLDSDGATATLDRDIRLITGHGAQRWVSVRVTNHRQKSTIGGWVLNIHDVTERKQAEEALQMLAHYDPLTGLPNRASLRRRLEDAVAGSSGATALLFADLDGFKAVNDDLGHESGDELLRAVAGRWSAVLRPGDVLGRWGGDEFMVICPGVTTPEGAAAIAQRLAGALVEPFGLEAGPAAVGVSVGVVNHVSGETAEDLIARADAQMYVAKRAGAPR